MRFALLGSGSEGNALLIEVGATRILMDCGFSVSETVARLARLEISPSQINAIVVTHEHADHMGGVARFARKYEMPVFLTHGTRLSQSDTFASLPSVIEISPHLAFSIGEIKIQPYPVPHDAREPVQYIFSDGVRKLGVLTDVGCSTPHIEHMLDDCNSLVLECNHDLELLMNGSYPYSLKQRVSGRLGHLNNQDAAALLARLNYVKFQHIVVAHISQRNNSPELAIAALCTALNCSAQRFLIADQAAGLPWQKID
jgi:phosphoribosyl 1,2-cyclic phosphodiesterase